MKSEWNIGTISEVCSLVTDGSHYSPKSCDNGEYMVSVKDFKGFGFDFSNCKHISSSDYEKMKASGCIPECGDILIGKDGARFFEDIIIYNQPEKPALLSSIAILRCNPDIILPQFLYYICKNPVFKKDVRDNYGSGSAIPRIVLKDFKRMPISYPDLDEQRRIVASLVAIDDRILLNIAINENLEQQAQALFKAWFVDFEPFGGVMPDDWIECILDSMCSLIIKGITPKYNEHSAQLVINQKCVRNHQIDLSLARCHEPKKVNEKWLQYGDIVVNSTGTGTLGRAAQVLFTPNNMTVDSHVTIIRASKQEYIYYLGLWATSHEHDFEMLQTGSTGQTDLPRERLKQMQIVLPSDSILSSFSKVIKPIADIRIQKQQENQRLSAFRDTLLPKLMNGEIDVSAVQV